MRGTKARSRASSTRFCPRMTEGVGMSQVLARSAGAAPFIDEAAHPRCHPVPVELVEIDGVDARILVLVLDLAPAVLDAHVHAHEHPALVGGERVAQAAEGDGE